MNRPRKKDRHLPACVFQRHGAIWYVKRGKWTRLGPTSDLAGALAEYARIQAHGRPARTSRFGFQPGQRVRMTGGLYAGREGVYHSAHSALQIKVAIGAGVVAVGARFVEPVREAA